MFLWDKMANNAVSYVIQVICYFSIVNKVNQQMCKFILDEKFVRIMFDKSSASSLESGELICRPKYL